jgi:predicted ATPase with chaperone activity
LETTKIHSVAGKIKDAGLMSQRPFRAPHHTASSLAMLKRYIDSIFYYPFNTTNNLVVLK